MVYIFVTILSSTIFYRDRVLQRTAVNVDELRATGKVYGLILRIQSPNVLACK